MQHAYKATDLAPDERVAVEWLLGRQLANDEAVEVIIHKLPKLPAAEQAKDRRHAAARIRDLAKGKSLGALRFVSLSTKRVA